jgi:hypothetical protein
MSNKVTCEELKHPHKSGCRCETCKLMVKHISWFREWRAELDGACIVGDDNKCVGCINCALNPLRATIQTQAG